MLERTKGTIIRAMRTARRQLRVASNYKIEKRAKQLNRNLQADGALCIPEEAAWTQFSVDELSGMRQAFDIVQGLSHEFCKDEERRNNSAGFPIQLLRTEDYVNHPEIMSLALHQDILAAVSDYFGQVPQLLGISIWWSPVVERLKGSQLFHYDHRDERQAKVFINLNDVDLDHGPLHFIDLERSERFNRLVGYRQTRIADEDVYSVIDPDEIHTTQGPAGSAFIVDTARCLHFGSRGNTKERLLLMANFGRVNLVDEHFNKLLAPVRGVIAERDFADNEVAKFALTAPLQS